MDYSVVRTDERVKFYWNTLKTYAEIDAVVILKGLDLEISTFFTCNIHNLLQMTKDYSTA